MQLTQLRSINLLGLMFLFSVILSTTLFAQEQATNVSSNIKLLQPGTKAPINILKEISGEEITFPIENKWNLVFYWSLFCHSCIEEMPEIQASMENLKGDNLSTFFISLDTEKMQKALNNFKKKRKFTSPILMEKVINEKYITADTWGVTMTPSVFIVNPQGEIAFAHQGPLDLELFIKNLPQEVTKNQKESIDNTSGDKNEQQ